MLKAFDANEHSLKCRPIEPREMCKQGAILFLIEPSSARAGSLKAMNLGFSSEAESCYVSISGYGEIIHDLARIDELWSVVARACFQNGSQSSNSDLLKFVPESAENWDSTSNKIVRLLAMASSVIVAEPIAIG
jgi:general stress protein 26